MAEESENISPMIRNFRLDFIKGVLRAEEMEKDPVKQFSAWLAQAYKSNELANAMTLSTVDAEGMPSSRVMLLRDISNGGFTFFTNYESQKGAEMSANAKAALLFFWPDLERQVRVQGEISKLPEKESDAYFESRPFESRVGALVSEQSTVIPDRLKMDEDFVEELKKYAGKEVPRPARWGGYVLKPVRMEFWQGRASRLHDRFRYRLETNGIWIMERLMP
jgi:pyridoxamine 5'-phosphate oxidase